jgi:hypothetical protein
MYIIKYENMWYLIIIIIIKAFILGMVENAGMGTGYGYG